MGRKPLASRSLGRPGRRRAKSEENNDQRKWRDPCASGVGAVGGGWGVAGERGHLAPGAPGGGGSREHGGPGARPEAALVITSKCCRQSQELQCGSGQRPEVCPWAPTRAGRPLHGPAGTSRLGGVRPTGKGCLPRPHHIASAAAGLQGSRCATPSSEQSSFLTVTILAGAACSSRRLRLAEGVSLLAMPASSAEKRPGRIQV